MRSEGACSVPLQVIVLALVGSGSACLPPSLSVPDGSRIACDDNSSCPEGFGCLEGPGRCAPYASGCLEDDGTFAIPVDDGETCVDGGVTGTCRAGVCGAACGNGLVDAAAGELCDFGADNSDDIADRCRTDCLPARCGDGIVDTGESCDDDGDDCDACFRICSVGTADGNGLVDDGCEAPLPVSFSAPAGAAQFLTPVGDALFYVDTDTDSIRSYDLVTNDDRLITTRTDFITKMVVVGDTIAWTEGSRATMFLLGQDGVPREQEDQITELAAGGGHLYVMGVDRLERRTLSSASVAVLPGELTFPPFLASGDDAVVWSTSDGLRILRHDAAASASRLALPGVFGAAAAAFEGETLWFLDDNLSLWRLAPDEEAVLLARMPAALAGHFPGGGMVSSGPGKIATALTLDPDSLEPGDEIAALLEADLNGTWTMRARDDVPFLSLAVAQEGLWISTPRGVLEVAR